jgi:ankyrin repeat protein
MLASAIDGISTERVASVRILVRAGADLFLPRTAPGRDWCALTRVAGGHPSFSANHAALLEFLIAMGGPSLIRARGTPALFSAIHAAYRQLVDMGLRPEVSAAFEAARGSYSRAVEALLRAGASPDAPDEEGQTPVVLAVRRGLADVLKALLAHGARVPPTDEQGRLLLPWVQAAPDPRVAELLVGCSLPAEEYPRSPAGLADAVAAGDLEQSMRLLDAGIDVNAGLPGGETPLTLAAALGTASMVAALVHRGAAIDAPSQGRWPGSGQTALVAAVRYRRVECVRALLDLGRDPSGGLALGDALGEAAECGFEEIVRILLTAGADPHSPDLRFQTPLVLAIKRRHFMIADLLLSAMNDGDTRRNDVQRALRTAAYERSIRAIRYLLERARDVFDQPAAYEGAVTGAAVRGDADIMRLLLASGASANSSRRHAAGIDDTTVLMDAVVFGGNPAVVRVLLEAGADVRARSSHTGRTALMFVHRARSWQDNGQMVDTLIEHGSELDARANDGETALMMAVRSGCYGVVRALLRHHPGLSLRNGDGQDVFDLAEKRGAPEIVELLQAARAECR